MKKHIIIALLSGATLFAACNKTDDHYAINCEPVEALTHGFGTQVTFRMETTETLNYFMTFSNTHPYEINFEVEFHDMPENITASIQQSSFALKDTRDYRNWVTLSTNNAAPGVYKIPYTVTTDEGGAREKELIITVSDKKDVTEQPNSKEDVARFVSN